MKRYQFIETVFGKRIKLSFKEELANAISHGVMAGLLLLTLPLVSVFGYIKKDWVLSLGYSIFFISLFLMFLMSCLYHSMSFDSKHKHIFRILDHCGIYIAIAGTFTPICLNVIKFPLGMIVLILQWFMVIIGILYKSITKMNAPKANTLLYLLMGWSAILLIPSLIINANLMLLIFIALGGILYSIGVIFYSQKTMPWFHFIWHCFINLAAIMHIIAIIFFI